MKKNYLTKNYFVSSFDVTIKNNSLFKKLALLLLIFFGLTNVIGQTSSSDCTNTTVGAQLTVGSSCTMVTFNSSNNTNYWTSASGCNAGAARDDAWGWFTATATTTTVNYYSADDAILHLFTGACAANMTALACSDNFAAGGTETITYATTVGVKYIIRIQQYNSNATMAGTICVYSPVPPPVITNLSAASGCVGTSLTLTGTGFTGATAVTIGGTAATINAGGTATSITVTIGSGTTGTVSITTPGGTGTRAGSFTVNPLPAAIGGAATVCTSSSITLTDASVGGTWSIANGTGTGSISGTGDVTGNTAGTLIVTYTLPTTCITTKTITVQDPPGAIAGGSATVCVNSATPAFTNPKAGGTWSVVNGSGTATITAGGILTGTAAGTVTVYYTISNCTPATYAVTVNPTPVAISGSATVCTGATTTLTDATAGGTWSITNGTGSATISATGDVSGSTAGTVTAIYTLPTTCSITKSITVQQTPGAIAGGAAAVCVSSATPAFTNPNAGGTWSVINGSGTATITAGGVLTGTAAGTVTVYYTIGLCTPATFAVTVNPTPVAIVGAATVCTGATTTLTDATPGGAWSVANGTGSATISATGDISGVTAGTVTVSYTLLPSCSITKSITVQQTPGPIAGGAATACVGSATPAFTNPNGGGTWSVINGSGTATITAVGVLTGTAAGTVSVNYTIGLCTPATFAVTVNPSPVAIVGAATVCTGTPITLTDATPGGTWSVANGTGSATISGTGDLSGVTAGSVTASYTLPTTCKATSAITVLQTPGAIAGGAATVCVGSSTPAFTNPSAGGTWSVLNGTGAATITAGGVLTGTSAGGVTVRYTNGTCTVATYAVTVNPAPAAPTAPANTLVTNSGFTVTWAASAGAVNYVLEVYTNAARTIPAPGSPFTVASPTVTYTVTGLNPSTTYWYQIKATNATCSSTYLLGLVNTLSQNDICTDAIALTVNPSTTCVTSTNSTTVGSTQSQAGCAGTSDDDVWFSFVATGTSHTVTVSPTTLANAVFQLFTGPCGALGAGFCVDNTAGLSQEIGIFTGMTIGATYYVRVYSRASGSGQGTFNICITSPPINDECSGAIPLTVSSTCSYGTYSNIGATDSIAVTTPGCGGYFGGDVWFSAVVPATGELDFDTQTGTMTDSGIAVYSGTCGTLTQLDCDDDSSANGLMSSIAVTGLTPGDIIYIRLWGYGGVSGTFGICASTPSCPSPSNLYANILSTTSVTVGWSPSPAASGGYQYYINTTGTPPTTGTTPTGSTLPGNTTVTLTGLTPGVKYYFWVRSFCGGTDVSTWYGPTNYTPCAVGNGTGTTTLGCTSPIAGGLGLSGADPAALSCSALTCPTLEVSYLPLKQTTTYAVSSIPYTPPYQFTCLQNPVSVNIDDIWSSTINLPFDFCFYGNNYNKCLIGSNGVITFDTVTYAPGGYSGWSITNNLPNAALFKNTIFGVYQDIDPSKGGQVGWELITLNTGCRALVASWNNIPMYSFACRNKLYTGMMVLYENTNVIDVYIKEKNICGNWNDGNAIVGVQNATGTAAVIAPNHNALDTNWAVASGSGEAWRFTPNGPSINPTVQWYQGSVLPANLIAGATGATYSPCPTITTSYTAQVTYPLCTGNLVVTDNAVVTVNGNKIWNGVTDTNWNIGTNWTPNGVPTNANCVVVPVVGNGRYPVISGIPNGLGYNLAVYSNASLTVGANQNLTITDKITVQASGAFTVNNNANLLQINDAAVNTGSIFYKRIAPNIKGSDYVYWSSPVLNQNMGTFYDPSFPYVSGYKYQWNTTLNNGNGAGGNISQGIWEAASGIMTRARGYIIRGSTSFGMPASSIPTTFNGTPFNGVIPYTVLRGTYTGAPYNGANTVQITNLNDNYNLLGNPYPSSMNALKFLQLNTYNVSTNPTGVILGNVKLWTHGTDPLLGVPNPFYGSFLYNYDANDYLTINYLGTTTPGAPDIIKSGQAFFVQMIDGPTGSGIVNFNNSMRFDTGNLPYSNSGFYKNGNTVTNEIALERHRIWLDLVDAANQSSRILVGYASDATNNYDSLFDAPSAVPASMKLFSMIENDSDVYDIQGRTLPFDANDEISIGIMAPTQGNYTFAIAAVDGLFENQNIYLKDNLLNITHDLKANPYHFTTSSGVTKDRFKIVYVDAALSNPDYSAENNIKVITNNEVAVSSSNLQMESIVVYNILGQKLATYKGINTNYFTLSNLHKNNTTLLLKIKLQTGEMVTRKILF